MKQQMKHFISHDKIPHRMVQLFVLVAHLVLLSWILYTLYEGGVLPFKTTMLHFLGISTYGALLIRFCAWYYKRQYLKEIEKNHDGPRLEK